MLTKGVESITGLLNQFTSGMRDGFKEYELKTNSVQTILANTAKQGTKLEDVTAALDELNDYADKTVYNFGDMTSAIGKFTTTGMSLEESTMSVKGLANAAAHAGASSSQLSMVLPQVSQALSQGFFAKADWKSIQTMGLETETLKETLIKFGKEYGTLTDEMGVDTANFAQNLTENQWLTKDVWNAAMSEYQDLNTEIGKQATQSATQVKTFTQLIGTIKEGIGSSWAQTWELLIGNFEEARDNWTEINNIIGNVVSMFGAHRTC
jgi:tape measure domain-containing protein